MLKFRIRHKIYKHPVPVNDIKIDVKSGSHSTLYNTEKTGCPSVSDFQKVIQHTTGDIFKLMALKVCVKPLKSPKKLVEYDFKQYVCFISNAVRHNRQRIVRAWGLDMKCILYWIGLHLFNDDTRPQRHISRLSQGGFSQLFMLCKRITECSDVVKVWWLIQEPHFLVGEWF